jgi:hypothetical protein
MTTAVASPPVPAPAPARRTPRIVDRTIRLTAVPDTDPPFDDELSAGHRVRRLPTAAAGSAPAAPAASAAAGSAPARSAPAGSAPITDFTAASTATAPLVASAEVPDMSHAPDVGVRPTPSAQLPAAQRTATALSRALIEVLTGARPVNQLRAHCAPPVFAGLLDRTPLSGAGMARLQSVHVCEPVDGVAEVSAVFRRGQRVRVIAFRLTGLDGRWLISALQVG